jgi:hypothetical protein
MRKAEHGDAAPKVGMSSLPYMTHWSRPKPPGMHSSLPHQGAEWIGAPSGLDDTR